ncbi:hypothetical protein WN943_025755 [Citrus x changshan-huyou]
MPWLNAFDAYCRPLWFWISNLEPFNGMWHLSLNGKPRGQFDVVIVAHNGDSVLLSLLGNPAQIQTPMERVPLPNHPGIPWRARMRIALHFPSCNDRKCANQLLGSSGLPQIARQMKAYALKDTRLELSSIWALLAAFEDLLPLGSASTLKSDAPHCWTSSTLQLYGKRNKIPQEIIPTATAEKVKTGMLEGVEAALGLPKSSLQKPNEWFIWTNLTSFCEDLGAALPTNTPSVPCIFVPQGRASICGGWLLASSVESAALGGMALANHIADNLGSGGVHPEELAVGLYNEFQPLEGHDIGQFPGFGVHGKRGSSSISTYFLNP